ncbi:MAG: zf-TFIIB domain-containing protein [Candidatus Binatia bacterium]
MNCPKCVKELNEIMYKGIQVDSCSTCEGMWLNFEELDQLEDKVFDRDELKGTTIFRTFPTDLKCPRCGKQMKKFNYRYYDLELDYCEDQHGFWLDKGEEKRVLELMQEEAKKMARKVNLEEKWVGTLRGLKSKDFFSKLKDLFR